MHRPELFQTNQTKLKLKNRIRIEAREAFLVNSGQPTDNRHNTIT